MVTIELPDDLAAALEAKAAAAGLDLQGYLAELALSQLVPNGSVEENGDTLNAQQELAAPAHPASAPLLEERRRVWRELVASMPPAEHDIDDSRESIYPDRA